MTIADRLRAAAPVALRHLAASSLVALICATLVFLVWYPFPYREISGGRELFMLLVTIDVAAGPLLTLIVFHRAKPRPELWRDLGVIAMLQLAALAYGLNTVYEARPVLLAFEGSRFRSVDAADVDRTLLHEAPEGMRALSLTGPKLAGVRLLSSDDPDYPESIRQSVAGYHPAFRPSRWMPYEQQRRSVAAASRAVTELRARLPAMAGKIDAAVAATEMPADRLGYLPLQSRTRDDWIVLVDRETGWPVGFAHVDGW